MSNCSFDSELAGRAVIRVGWRSDSSASWKRAFCRGSEHAAYRLGLDTLPTGAGLGTDMDPWIDSCFSGHKPRSHFFASRSIKDFPGLTLLSVSLHSSCSWFVSLGPRDAGSHISHSVNQRPITPTALISFDFTRSVREDGEWNSVVSLSSCGLYFWHTRVHTHTHTRLHLHASAVRVV